MDAHPDFLLQLLEESMKSFNEDESLKHLVETY